MGPLFCNAGEIRLHGYINIGRQFVPTALSEKTAVMFIPLSVDVATLNF